VRGKQAEQPAVDKCFKDPGKPLVLKTNTSVNCVDQSQNQISSETESPDPPTGMLFNVRTSQHTVAKITERGEKGQIG